MTAGGRLAVVSGCAAIVGLAIWATSGGGRIDSSATLAIAPRRAQAVVAPTSVLWVVAIGVSQYQNSNFNLQFADADARADARALQDQSNSSLYRETKTLVLTNEEVTRESILNGLERFLGQAGPDDVVVIFMAGHGVQDRASRSYYFMPFAATAENIVTAGLRMSDFDEMVRVVRRNVRGLVLMMDTCHAGALRVTSPDLVPADDTSAKLSAGEGFFLLAASKPGEDSKENPELAHGAFTYALLEGLHGAADTDGDDLVSVSDLFGYVARAVPRLSGGGQHPYHKMEGTDLILVAVKHDHAPTTAATAAPLLAENSVPPPPTAPVANTIGVMEFRDLRTEPQNDWIGKAVRVALNTELSKVRALRVYSSDAIDRNIDARRPDQLATAQRLGIGTLLTGSFHVIGDTIRIDAQIIDTTSGVQKGSDSVQGKVDDFFDLQKKLVLSMLRRLPVEVSAAEGQSIQTPGNTNVNAYKLLLQAEGIVAEPAPVPAATRGSKSASSPHSRAEWFARRAFAGETEPGADDAEVREFLEEYRLALVHKDIDHLATLYVSFSARQREAQRAYLDNATDLAVDLANITIEHREYEVTVSFTRRDHFIDRESGKPTPVEIRLDKPLVRVGGQWKFAGSR